MTFGYEIDAIDAARTARSSGFGGPSIRMISSSTCLFKAAMPTHKEADVQVMKTQGRAPRVMITDNRGL
jgi:hypothetical protein